MGYAMYIINPPFFFELLSIISWLQSPVSLENTLHTLGSSSSSSNAYIGDLSLATASPEVPRSSTQPQDMLSIKNVNDKQPDKILPCPRCNSLDTKFCYYNNYNVNQPRHFCKNCQRYWTAGGTLRNVAVGAGRRKRKHNSGDSKSGGVDSAETVGDTPNRKAMRTKAIPHDEFAHQSVETTKPHHLRYLFASSGLSLHDQKNNPIYGYVGPTPPPNRAFYRDEGSDMEQIGSNVGTSYNLEGLDKEGLGFNLGTFFKVEGSDIDQVSSINIGLVSESNTLNGECGRSPPSESSCGRQHSMESACTSTITISQGVGKDGCTTGVKLDDLICPEVDQGGDGNEHDNQIHDECNGQFACNNTNTRIVGSSSGTRLFGSPHSLALGLSNISSWDVALEQPNPFPGVAWPLVHRPMWTKPTDADPERRLWAPKTLRINDPNDAAWSSIWSNLGLKGEGVSLSSSTTKGAFECHAKKKAFIPEAQSQHVSPAAFTQSMVFQE